MKKQIIILLSASLFALSGCSSAGSAPAEDYSASWRDVRFNPANNLTLFIQKNGETEHEYTFTIQSADASYVIPVSIARGGALSYTSVRINMQDAVSSSGEFMIDGGMLIWSRNDALIEFENATIFTKVQ